MENIETRRNEEVESSPETLEQALELSKTFEKEGSAWPELEKFANS
ncbi:MAG: hypothetical protein KW804_03605 [Candidatus Doudnabacteria bacterium]|nr:hypothetical protein [Candidatus Doudnabacteria bacterium]